MRLINADELITAFPCGESVRTESVRATINHMPTIEISEDCDTCYFEECPTDEAPCAYCFLVSSMWEPKKGQTNGNIH